MGTLAMIGYKVKLYSSMTKQKADISWFNYLIKLKKRQFGLDFYKVTRGYQCAVPAPTLACALDYKRGTFLVRGFVTFWPGRLWRKTGAWGPTR